MLTSQSKTEKTPSGSPCFWTKWSEQCSLKGTEMSCISTSLAVSRPTCNWTRGRRECEGQALHGVSETPSKCTTRPFLNSAIVIWTSYQVSQLYNTLGAIVSNLLLQGKDDWENKKGGTQASSALKLTGCKILCYSPKRRDDWGDSLSSEEGKMSGVQQRLKLKQTPIDTWSLKEHLTLASAVLK